MIVILRPIPQFLVTVILQRPPASLPETPHLGRDTNDRSMVIRRFNTR